jgi:multisubunit Na+/H+ antiporter MnhB subunit
MNWLPLTVLSRPVMLLLVAMSVIVLLRGHNEPGGGFIGGLLAAAGFLVYALAHDATAARQLLRTSPVSLLGWGLLLAAGSGLPGMVGGQAFLTGQWGGSIPGIGKLSTVLLFDVGIYLVVLGAGAQLLLGLLERAQHQEADS